MIGKIVSHHKILEKLGSGGMGEVYLAEDTKLKRKVALKFLPKEYTGGGANGDSPVKRFQREAQAAAALNHPNIVTIHEINEHEGQTYIAMEYAEGQTLKEFISGIRAGGAPPSDQRANRHSPLPMDEIIDFTTQICEGLSAAHKEGIVHRDIKPQNIIINNEGRAKILDFGLAKLKGVSPLTKESSTLGTVHYMSPEQARGEEVDHRTDIWSLGVVLYEMLTGELPFKGDYEQAVIYSIINEEPDSLPTTVTETQSELQQLVNRLLQKDKNRRFQNSSEVLPRLTSIQKEIVNISSNHDITGKGKIPSIAVLPFADMSREKDQEYFCDGVAEEIINALTHIIDLRIIARTSAFSFKNQNLDVREIGKKLNVDFLLEGSVRKAGKNLRITAQMIDISDGSHVWSERYDRELTDIFSIQDEMAVRITEKMEISLKKPEQELITKRYTEDTEAYNLYLKGRYFWNQWSREGFLKGIELFEKAVQRDPDFAQAVASIAYCHVFLAWYYFSDPAESFIQARKAALTALNMDEQLSEAHSVLALVNMVFDKKWREAEKEFKRSLALNPGYSIAHIFYTFYLAAQKRHDESIAHAKIGLSLDPLTLFPGLNLGMRYYYAREYSHSLEVMKNALDLNPGVAMSQLYISLPLLMNRQYEEALKRVQSAINQVGRDQSELLTMLGIIEVFRGQKQKAEKILEELDILSKSKQISYGFMGIFCVVLDKFDDAFRWFEQGLERHDHILIFLGVDPLLDPVQNNPRFQKLLRKIGLPA